MSVKQYMNLLSKNTRESWFFSISILVLASVTESCLKLVSWKYTIIFTILGYTFLLFGIRAKSDRALVYCYRMGYLALYTFVLLVYGTQSSFGFVAPLLVTLLVYCDKSLIVNTILYVFGADIVYLFFRYKNILEIPTIQNSYLCWCNEISYIVVTGVVAYKVAILLKQRDEIMDSLVNDLYTDDLTGLYNIRFIEENKDKAFDWDKCVNLSIAFIDIDNFKNFNTLYGHMFGDEVLVVASKIMRLCCIRNTSMYAVRVGGDEFVIIGINKSEKEFLRAVDDIRCNIHNKKVKFNNEYVGIDISIGVANKIMDENCSSFTDLYKLADDRNNIAKERGKNRVISFS